MRLFISIVLGMVSMNSFALQAILKPNDYFVANWPVSFAYIQNMHELPFSFDFVTFDKQEGELKQYKTISFKGKLVFHSYNFQTGEYKTSFTLDRGATLATIELATNKKVIKSFPNAYLSFAGSPKNTLEWNGKITKQFKQNAFSAPAFADKTKSALVIMEPKGSPGAVLGVNQPIIIDVNLNG